MLHTGIPVTAHDLRLLGHSHWLVLVWLVGASSHTLDCSQPGNRSLWCRPHYGLHVGEYLPCGLLLGSCSFCGMSNSFLSCHINEEALCKLTFRRLQLVPRCDLWSELCSLWPDRQCTAPSGLDGETLSWNLSPWLCAQCLSCLRDMAPQFARIPRFQVRL